MRNRSKLRKNGIKAGGSEDKIKVSRPRKCGHPKQSAKMKSNLQAGGPGKSGRHKRRANPEDVQQAVTQGLSSMQANSSQTNGARQYKNATKNSDSHKGAQSVMRRCSQSRKATTASSALARVVKVRSRKL